MKEERKGDSNGMLADRNENVLGGEREKVRRMKAREREGKREREREREWRKETSRRALLYALQM